MLLSTVAVKAAPPTLIISPENYSYDLSITGVLIEDCQELKNPDNILIARINGELRGFSNSSILAGGRYLAFLTVYSNKPSGDTIQFQIYNKDSDKLIPVKNLIIFQDDAIYGSPGIPQEIITNNRPANLSLSTLFIPEHPAPDQDLATINATDADKDNFLAYSLVSGSNSTDNSSFKIVNNKLRFNGKVNTLAQDTFKIRLRASDNFSCFVEEEFNLVVDKVNDVPTNLHLSDSLFFENTTNPVIGRFSAVDQDLFDRFRYSLVSGTGDTDNNLFILSDSNLVLKDKANFEVKKVYTIRCRVTDIGNLFFERTFKVFVKDNNDPPTDIIASNVKVFENESKNQLICKVSTVDEDAVDKYIYTFANIGTNDNTSFTISNDSLKTNLIFDFETKSSYFIYLTSTDSSGVPVTKPFTISIKDTFDIPTNIFLSHDSVPENSVAKTIIGKLSTEDANLPKPAKYLYTFVSGAGDADNAQFQIGNDTLYSETVFDFEIKSSYSIRLKTALPNGMAIEKSFLINVKDVNEAPTLITLSEDTTAENKADSSSVAALSTVDQEGGSNFKYTLAAGDGSEDNSAFVISNSLLILVKSADFEKKETYKIRIKTTDAGGTSLEMPFIIRITDVNEKPVIQLMDYQVPESAGLQTPIGTVTVKDVDKNQTAYYKILTSGLPFAIDSITGNLILTQSVDYETKKVYEFWVWASDNGVPALSDSLLLKVYVLDEIEAGLLPSADLVTPNGDGKNDTWNITNVELYKDYSLKIVDEYSQLVYSADNNYQNDWDARMNGTALPAGVYYYVFKSNSDSKLFKGYITVIK